MLSTEREGLRPRVAPEIAAIYADFFELAPEHVRAEAQVVDGALLVSVFGTTTGVEAQLIEKGEFALAHQQRNSIHRVLTERLMAAVREAGGRTVSGVSEAMDFEAGAERLSFSFAEG